MPFPSHIMAMGQSAGATGAIVGSGATGLVATGSTAADALQLSNTFNTFTTGSAGGAKLQPTEVGAWVVIRNDSGNTITVYPFNTSSTVNAAAASVTVATAKTMILFATSSTTWASILTA
jgi:hypothetical protein